MDVLRIMVKDASFAFARLQSLAGQQFQWCHSKWEITATVHGLLLRFSRVLPYFSLLDQKDNRTMSGDPPVWDMPLEWPTYIFSWMDKATFLSDIEPQMAGLVDRWHYINTSSYLQDTGLQNIIVNRPIVRTSTAGASLKQCECHYFE